MKESLDARSESFVKLSWVHIKNKRMLFVRSPEGDVFFDPGCRRIEGISDEKVLREKMLDELHVELLLPLMKINNFGFSVPAYGKPEGTMAEAVVYMGSCLGMPQTTSYIAEVAWFSSSDMDKTSDLGKALLQQLSSEGLID